MLVGRPAGYVPIKKVGIVRKLTGAGSLSEYGFSNPNNCDCKNLNRNKMNISRLKITDILGILLLLIVIYFFVSRYHYLEQSKYTAGKIYNSRMTIKSGKRLDFQFWINGKKFRGSVDYEVGIDTSLWYLVKYDSLDPNMSYLFIDKPINKFVDIPINGWTNLPDENDIFMKPIK